MNVQSQVATLLPLVAATSHNPVRAPGITCATCATPVSAPSFSTCWRCNQHASTPRSRSGSLLARQIIPMRYAIRGQQSYVDARAYKNPWIAPDRNHSLLRMRVLTSLFSLVHAQCIGNAVGQAVDAVAVVPSLAPRSGAHPLLDVARFLPRQWRRISLVPNLNVPVDRRRDVEPSHFSLPTHEEVRGCHVVVFDDTWTTGGHAQSASVMLRTNGAALTSILVVNRDLDPGFGNTAAFIAQNVAGRPFDPWRYPVTGTHCPAG